uniref:Zgc:163014 n=1 Tax=Latimeria chalumnae TaxID=7897 RepID=H3B1T3_LATCH
MSYQLQLPLPLPNYLVIFGLGDWNSYSMETTMSVELFLSPDVKSQEIGKLSKSNRSLVWEGEWRLDLLMASLKQAETGAPAKILLTINGQVTFSAAKEAAPAGVQSEWRPEEKRGWTERRNEGNPGKTSKGNAEEKPGAFYRISHMVFGLCCLLVCPSPRWNHAMCLSDPKTAVLIGGEGYEHQHCRDPLWKLEIENGFWFPMDSSLLGPAPQLSRGHTATYDPETKRIFVFGGMKQEQHNDMYILDTMTWKWSVVAAKGKVPTLAFHSATIYQKELFVFGGVFPQLSSEVETCSNTLLIFNPDYELWYQPLVEGEKPLSRFGHSATLLRNKLVIFGGKRSPAFLNDVYILDLGFMEYISVRTNSPQPSPRGFHAAVPVSDHKALISGGCNITGVLWDTFIFNVETLSWCTLSHDVLSSVPRTGHTMINLASTQLTDTNKDSQEKGKCCTILVFGGSDGNEKFYNDMVKICLDLEK